jgi:phosphatidate cytidylyltransferase
VNNFFKRSITGVFFVAVLIGGIWFHAISCFLLFSLIVFFGLLELYSIIENTGIKANKPLGIAAGLVHLSITFLYSIGMVPMAAFWLVTPLIAAIFVTELYRKQELPFQNIAFSIFGVLYIALPFSLLLLTGFPEHQISGYVPTMILGYFFLLWTCDTGAYLTGISIGRHPMFARISPKKSWEGFSGGMILTVIVAIILSNYFTVLSRTDWVVIALIISTFGVWGDLIESMLKRSLQIKDSGSILPGHGGILDRFDSVLFSVPMVFLYLQLKTLILF